MELKKIPILLILVIAAHQIQGAATNKDDFPVIPDSTTEPPVNTTTTETPTTSSSTSTTTTTPATTTSTTDSTTSSSSSTEAPTTTTTAAPPTPTPKPEPVPKPDMQKWHYRNETTKQTCIIVQMAIQLNFTYVVNDKSNKNVLYNLPANDTTVKDGYCDGEKNWLQLAWKNGNASLIFSVNNTVKEYQLAQLQFNLNVSGIFSDAQANQTLTLVHKRNEFATPLTMSYHCARQQVLNLTSTDPQEVTLLGQALVTRLQLEAFHTRDSDVFSTAKDCDAIDTPDIVPIAVGCALAGLVVIVLIAYLVGRRRAQARGYLSM
ncbi:Lysosome-associated membrane glycoprotein [Sergentomyia squamirostris]